MREIVALEYREQDWPNAAALARRVGEVAEACAKAGLEAVGLVDLLEGTVAARGEGPALLFGLRAQSAGAVVAVAEALSMRGFCSLYSWTKGHRAASKPVDPVVLLGHGMVEARGGKRLLYGASPAGVREQISGDEQSSYTRWPSIWMPAPDRFGRAVDGVVIEEMQRRNVDVVWTPGSGINTTGQPGERGGIQIIEARPDDGRLKAQMIARWAQGHRLDRGRVRVADLADRPRRWLRELTGLR